MFEARGLRRLQVGPVDLQLAPGTCTAVTGPSGVGKSVLLRMLADLDPHEGEAWLDGQARSSVPGSQWRRSVGYVPAESGWWATRVDEHFAPGLDLAPLLSAVGIRTEAAGWPVARLSTGERQRMALLRALSAEPRVLLLDEPTSGLDGESVARVESLLQERRTQGLTLLWVTHDLAQAARVADRHLILRDGRLA
jgi:ABC-type multidrug transport system ATPase subunit